MDIMEILGYWIPGGNGESALNWKEIFKELYKRVTKGTSFSGRR